VGENAEERTEENKLKKRININGGTGLNLSKSWRKWDWYAARGLLERTRLDRWPAWTIRKLWITSCLLPWCL